MCPKNKQQPFFPFRAEVKHHNTVNQIDEMLIKLFYHLK